MHRMLHFSANQRSMELSFIKKTCLLMTICLVASHVSVAQTSGISGLVEAEDGTSLPYANVIVVGKAIGTSTNFDGEYSLQLPPGEYQISFQYVGYKSALRKINVAQNVFTKVSVQLAEEKLLLEAITVSANGENPAYRIIRGAQASKDKNLKEIEAVGYMAYTKLFGKSKEDRSAALTFFGTRLTPRKGIFYLSESVVDIYQYEYNKRTEVLKASLVLSDTSGYSQNYSNFIEFYQDKPMQVRSGAVANRMISPIAKDAFAFYDYELEGDIKVNGQLIHKIKVIPKAKNGITFAGDIYIIDDSWHLYKTQLTLDNPLVGKFEISNSYIKEDTEEVWLPFTCSIVLLEEKQDLNIVYHNIHYDFNFEQTPPSYNEQTNYVVEDTNLLKDSAWWAKTRPIALTEDEKNAYDMKKRAAIANARDSNNFIIDTTLVIAENEPGFGEKIGQAFTTGEFPINKKFALKANLFSFNTIEGGVLKPGLIYRAQPNQKNFKAELDLRYGIASETFYGRITLDYELNPLKRTYLKLSTGSYVEHIAGFETITDYINMVYSLFEENFMKLYQNNYASGAIQTEIFNGFDATFFSTYAVRSPLQNNSDYNWAEEEDYTFTPNQANINSTFVDFTTSDLWENSVMLRYQYGRRYNLIKGRKIPLVSKYPKLAFKADLGSLDVSYLRYAFNIADDWSMGKLGRSSLSLSYGDYISKDNLTPIDFFHFNGNQTFKHQTENQFGLSFQTLNYYQYSTADFFFGGNFEHDFNTILFSWVPFLKKIDLKTYLSANYLQTSLTDAYSEVGFGLSTSFVPIKFYYHWGFEGQNNIGGRFTFQTSF